MLRDNSKRVIAPAERPYALLPKRRISVVSYKSAEIKINIKRRRSMTQEKIDRINELARKSRTPEGLTAEEKEEQTALRSEFRAAFRANLESQLKNIEFVDKK